MFYPVFSTAAVPFVPRVPVVISCLLRYACVNHLVVVAAAVVVRGLLCACLFAMKVHTLDKKHRITIAMNPLLVDLLD